MSDNSQKTPLGQALNAFAAAKALDQIQMLGKALPATVVSMDKGIVTVKVELQSGFTLPQLSVPVAMPQYLRMPLQAGDPGVLQPADVRLGGLSGQGDGIATLDQPANLAALVFVPLANTHWIEVDPNVLTMYGPQGTTVRNVAGDTRIDLRDDSVALTTPSASIIAANGRVDINGELYINGKRYLDHRHMAPTGQTFGVAPVNGLAGPAGMSGAPGLSV